MFSIREQRQALKTIRELKSEARAASRNERNEILAVVQRAANQVRALASRETLRSYVTYKSPQLPRDSPLLRQATTRVGRPKSAACT